ncbi:MAG: ABC transporter substrate-binding protein [Desulfitobacteriaceae bacterium]|nr:ABC transporter substrate-binding protein [Desulfitobacteriaceae bacterium]
MKITATDKIGYILDQYPESYEVFLANGFNSNSRAELIGLLGKDTMLSTVLKVKDINVDLFVRMINRKTNNGCQIEQIAYDAYNPDLPVNLMVKTACAVNALFKEKLSEALNNYKEKTGIKINTYFVNGCEGAHELEPFWQQTSVDTLPDIIMSMSFDEIYDKRFIDKYVKKTGYFESALKSIDEEYVDLGCLDDSYTLNAGLVMVFLIDQKNLGDLPVPKKWADLLNPIYKDKIIGFGSGIEAKGIFEYPLYYFHKEFGTEGLKKFAGNVKHIYHGQKMAKLAGTNSKEAGGVYTIPLTFAKLCRNKDVSIVFPEDGAWIIPIAFLVKKNKNKELDFIINFLLDNYGQMCADINGVSFNPKIQNKIPPGTKLKWLGWDYIKSNDILSLGKQLHKDFHEVWDQKS